MGGANKESPFLQYSNVTACPTAASFLCLDPDCSMRPTFSQDPSLGCVSLLDKEDLFIVHIRDHRLPRRQGWATQLGEIFRHFPQHSQYKCIHIIFVFKALKCYILDSEYINLLLETPVIV